MKLLWVFYLALLALPLCAETESEKVFRQAIPGTYGRMDGMVYLSVDLRCDGTYVFTQADCFTAGSQKGKWSIQDDVVVLDRKEPVFRRFRIFPTKGSKGLALLPLDDDEIRKDQAEEERLFMPHEKEKA